MYEGSSFSTFLPILAVICLWIIAILEGVKCYHTVVLMCIFLLANDVEHLFTCLLAICISFFGELFIQILCPFLIGLFIFLLGFHSSLCILDTSLLTDTWFAKAFSLFVCCLFTFLVVPFEAQELFTLLMYSLSIFSFVIFVFGVIYLWNHCLIQYHEYLYLYFLLGVL